MISRPVLFVVCVLAAWPAQAQQAATAAAPASAQVTPAPARRPPFPNRANDVLPKWLRVRGEFRERIEGFSGLGFVPERDDAYGLSRLRLNTTIAPSPALSFQVQVQDARVAKKQVGPTAAPFKGALDLRTAFADLGSAKSQVVARVGRQELAYGDQRLVGHVSWLNTARTFDAARVTIRGKKVQADAFAASVVRILPSEFDKSGNGNQFMGTYVTTGALIPQSAVEPYLFVRRDRNLRTELGATDDLTMATIGVRWVGKLPARLDYNIEMAGQTGSLGADDVAAWAGHWLVRETFPGKLAPRVWGEFNFASGDANPTDGTRGTFDQLYPTPHDKYGLSDQVGWRNIRHLSAGLMLNMWKQWQLNTSAHEWWLADSHDALYAASGAVLVPRVSAGATSSYVGGEFDVQVTRALTPQLQLAAGYAHIFPGAFLKRATPGASYSAPYVMATYVFLADK